MKAGVRANYEKNPVCKGVSTKTDAERVVPELDKGYPEPHRIGTTFAHGLFARHVTGLELFDICFDFEEEHLRSALIAIDVDGLEIDDFPVKFDDVKGLVIHNSAVLM